MAFRSELDAMRERAEGAEAEARRLTGDLDAQKARIERVADVESQLEGARAQLREHKASPYAWARGSLVPLGLGVLLGGAAMFVQGQERLAAQREAASTAEHAHDAERRALEREAESARDAANVSSADRDDMRSQLEHGRDELRQVLAAIIAATAPPPPHPSRVPLRGAPVPPAPPGAEGAPLVPPPDGSTPPVSSDGLRGLPFGRVVDVDGDAPVADGAACEIVALRGADECVGQLRCGGATVHSFGCSGPMSTRLRGDSARLSVESDLLGWRVVVAPAAGAAADPPAFPFPFPGLIPRLTDPDPAPP